mmetsp:Transcript_12576/g.21252  ORF Transcript_12576/g.21252 Transcript_12576/m.21252 type:complete len:236 (+) Transcript_12576:1774-2481(+)
MRLETFARTTPVCRDRQENVFVALQHQFFECVGCDHGQTFVRRIRITRRTFLRFTSFFIAQRAFLLLWTAAHTVHLTLPRTSQRMNTHNLCCIQITWSYFNKSKNSCNRAMSACMTQQIQTVFVGSALSSGSGRDVDIGVVVVVWRRFRVFDHIVAVVFRRRCANDVRAVWSQHFRVRHDLLAKQLPVEMNGDCASLVVDRHRNQRPLMTTHFQSTFQFIRSRSFEFRFIIIFFF